MIADQQTNEVPQAHTISMPIGHATSVQVRCLPLDTITQESRIDTWRYSPATMRIMLAQRGFDLSRPVFQVVQPCRAPVVFQCIDAMDDILASAGLTRVWGYEVRRFRA